MLAQIRIYTINRGEMDAFIENFKEETIPLHERLGIKLAGTYVNRPQNEFIWIRTFADEADRDAKSKAFQQSPERVAAASRPSRVAKMEVREVEVV